MQVGVKLFARLHLIEQRFLIPVFQQVAIHIFRGFIHGTESAEWVQHHIHIHCRQLLTAVKGSLTKLGNVGQNRHRFTCGTTQCR
ncbi:Uncharacterised protein [Vibrio cholerae]|nr:Uncharacterised protein [Vibrio cholerae]